MIDFLWFIVRFVALTTVYLVIALGVIKVCTQDPKKVWHNNNTWFFVAGAMTFVTFVIALFNFGPSVVIPDLVTAEHVNKVRDFFSKSWNGQPVVERYTTETLPWKGGTWFWWQSFGIYLVATTTLLAVFSDEVWAIFSSIGKGVANIDTQGAIGDAAKNVGSGLVSHQADRVIHQSGLKGWLQKKFGGGN